MATTNGQSQLRRCLPLLLLVALTGLAGSGASVGATNYRPFNGDRFFLLSETSFDSESTATVRLEAPGRGSGLEEYSGADIVVYRVPDPIEFLKRQKNLHRIKVESNYRGEGLANTLRVIWDNWYKQSRAAWQRLFSYEARKQATQSVPALKQSAPNSYTTTLENNPQFEPLKGFELVDRFRYPLFKAKPIQPPDAKLAGSSSNFMTANTGNVMIPIGKRKPGLYLVEAIIGTFRATTLVFVSDHVAFSKVSGEQLLVWMSKRKSGVPAEGVEVLLSDGLGVLASGRSDRNGFVLFDKKSPEHGYVIGADQDGGVFVSENYYYDSEIYDNKLYAFTDRPLYRPGDWVSIKLLGRHFQDARRSTPMTAGPVKLTVSDALATPILSKELVLTAEHGAEGGFRLPENATPGGYTMTLGYGGATHGSSFRVVEYVKPHYEIHISLNKASFDIGEPIRGQVRLSYPSGNPVTSAKLQLSVRSQKLTMVEGEVRYEGRFPVRLTNELLSVGGDGTAAFELPPATVPSRYILHILSTDGAAYRVTADKEILIQSGSGNYVVESDTHLSQPREVVTFLFRRQGLAEGGARPVKGEVIRLENQSKAELPIAEGADRFGVQFLQSGSYSVVIKDARDNVVGSTSHWVAGPGLTPSAGGISIVLDKDTYVTNETARALITFSHPVDEALITLERDRVEHHGLLSGRHDWIRLRKLSDKQWSAEIPVRDTYAPNITFSVLYAKNGNWLFQNKGIKVSIPSLSVDFKTDKMQYLPGERVTVEVITRFKGRPMPASVAVSVVDEMVYVLQPEIAPDIRDFFYHPRRSSVRTSASLSFHTYDMALSANGAPPAASRYQERSIKTLERPRRENIDTAAWLPTLKTDDEGRATFSFIMPDSLSRWRLTGRAMAADGTVGQNTAHIVSSKDVYLKWSGPTLFRQGDKPTITLVTFNQTEAAKQAEVAVDALGTKSRRKVELAPGPNWLTLDLTADRSGAVTAAVVVDGKESDRVQTDIRVIPPLWLTSRSARLQVRQPDTTFALPSEATNVRLSFSRNGSDKFLDVLDGLLDYPYGCVEQTASRLVPLTIAHTHMREFGLAPRVTARIENNLVTGRRRLVEMAGPHATFGWWGDMTHESALMTAYAYYADWRAARSLGIELPPAHWNNLLNVYRDKGSAEPVANQALILWLAGEIGLPTRTLVEGALTRAASQAKGAPTEEPLDASLLLSDPNSAEGSAMALVLLKLVAAQAQVNLEPDLVRRVDLARRTLATSEPPLMRALALLARKRLDQETDYGAASALLDELKSETPTLDRALSLLFLDEALGFGEKVSAPALSLEGGWRRVESPLGREQWTYEGAPTGPLQIKLPRVPEGPLFATISYDSHEREEHTLPIHIDRQLYRLRPGAGELEFDAEPLGSWRVDANDLYVDEIRLTPKGGDPFRYGLVEVPLPPGGEVESTTWGLQVRFPKEESAADMEKARHASSAHGYSIPIEELSRTVVIRHLVRFSQRGQFAMPMVRYFRMYEPNHKAFEGADGGLMTRVVVE